jgi:hypothetical protein
MPDGKPYNPQVWRVNVRTRTLSLEPIPPHNSVFDVPNEAMDKIFEWQ